MPNLGAPELIIIVVLVLLLFGARKLPELGSSVGRSIKNFKKGVADAHDEEAASGEPEPARADAEPPRQVTAGADSPQPRAASEGAHADASRDER